MRTQSVNFTYNKHDYVFDLPAIGDGRLTERMRDSGTFYEAKALTAIQALGLEGAYVDGGAFVGTHSVFFDRECPSTKVFTIEMQDWAQPILTRNLEQNGCTKCVMHHKMLGANVTDRFRIIPGPRSNRGMARIDHAPKSGKHTSTTIDELVGDTRVALIKLDLEGAEFMAMHGALNTIRRDRPVIVAEALTPNAFVCVRSALPHRYYVADQLGKHLYLWSPK